MAIFDKAKWHFELPDDLNLEQAYVHTGFFLGWIIDRGLHSSWLAQEYETLVAAYQRREITGPELFEEIDGVLGSEELNEEGNEFARAYYDQYIEDFEQVLAGDLPSAYHVRDSADNYRQISAIIDQRYSAWKE